MTTDDDRVAYLEGEGDASLDADERGQLDELRALLADEALWAAPPDDLEERVVAAVAAAQTADAEPEAALPPPVVRTSPMASPPMVARRSGGAGRRGWMLVAGGIAAALVLIVGAGFLARAGRDGGGDTFALSLAGTDVAPSATGDATLTQNDSGWRIDLDATGLPRLDAGRFYEAWLRNEEGVLVSIGTFNEPTDVILWAGVTPRAFPVLTVTEEEADGNPASSGRVVLRGQLDLDG